jgi:hypothetical protein
MQPALSATLPDDAEIVGVVVNGKARAYLLKALAPLDHHVVNDLVAGVPLSITYCNETQCLRAFTGKTAGQPLDIWTGGYANGLLLKVGSDFFEQQSGKGLSPGTTFPYQDYPHERTTWKAWKEAHPASEVYAG